MDNRILETEYILNTLLPPARLTEKPPADLLKVAKEWSETVWQQAKQLGPMRLSAEEIQQGINLSGNAVYICGVHRSGTTLVRDILDDHPELVVLPSEGTFYTNLEATLQKLPVYERIAFLGKEWLRRLANPINQPPYWLLGRSTPTHSPYVTFARYLMAWWPVHYNKTEKHWPHTAVILAYASVTNKLNAKYWVDKSPMYEAFLDRIWSDTPKAKVIHLIRDPYAVISSRKKMEPSISLIRMVKDIRKSYQIAYRQRTLNDAQFMLVRYEDVCEDTSLFIETLTMFLNIKPHPSLTSPSVTGKPVQANSSFITNGAAGQIISSSHYNRAEMLSHHEQSLLAAYLQPLAGKMGYELPAMSYLKRAYIKLSYDFIGRLIKWHL